MLAWCGFKIIWQSMLDLKDVAPVARRRWLAVAVPKLFEHPIPGVLAFPKLPLKSLSEFQTFVALPDVHEEDLTLDEALKIIYGNPTLLKNFKRQRNDVKPTEHVDVLHLRVRHGHSCLGTILASYGNQHSFSMTRLQDRGLFAELFMGRFGVRFFSPCEVAVLHGLVVSMAFPLFSRLGHIAVGNCIAVQHATMVLGLIRSLLEPRRKIDPVMLLIQVCGMRLHSGNSVVIVRGENIWIVRKEVMDTSSIGVVPEQVCELSQPIHASSTDDLFQACASFTLPFQVHFAVKCVMPDGCCHVLRVAEHETLHDALVQVGVHPKKLWIAVDPDFEVYCLEHTFSGDMDLVIHELTVKAWDLYMYGATWIVVEKGAAPQDALSRHLKNGIHRDIIIIMDQALNLVSAEKVMSCRMLIVVATKPVQSHDLINWNLDFGLSLDEVCKALPFEIPILRVASDHITIAVRESSFLPDVRRHVCDVLNAMHHVICGLKWKWIESEEPDVPCLLGRLFPTGSLSAPSGAVAFVICRLFLNGVLSHLACDDGIQVQFSMNGLLLWKGKLSGDLCVIQLQNLVGLVIDQLGGGLVSWVYRGRRCPWIGRLRTLLDEAKGCDILKLHLVSSLHGGASKIEVWREAKSLLGKELIQRGWPLEGLDSITSEWVQKLGANKVFNLMKQQSSERRWSNIVDSAKWEGLAVTPADPVRLRGARTIQKAIRNRKPVAISSNDYTLCDGFFTKPDGSPVEVHSKVDLKSVGVCFVSTEDALQWVRKTGPLVHDPLAVLIVYDPNLPIDVVSSQIITFPALDNLGRRVILRGRLWQLGSDEIKIATHEHKVAAAPTHVVAFTIWRDECTDMQWDDFTKALVKTTFQLLDGIDVNQHILQVWGRSFRDLHTRVDPERALSAQFHCRILSTCVEQLLQLSGRGPVYMTPKTDDHMAHPDWGMLWLADKVEANIAAERATEHSGLARSKKKFALRVKTSLMDQIAKEVMPSKPFQLSTPIKSLFKLEPLPTGLTHEAIVDWAKGIGWNIRVVKKLGKYAALVGADCKPKHEHVSMNGELILIKQVDSKPVAAAKSQFVAGPRPIVKKHEVNKGGDYARDLVYENDAWSQYRTMKGLSRGNNDAGSRVAAPTGGSRPAPPALTSQVEGPTAAKFSAIEDRIAKFESTIVQLQAQQQQIVSGVENVEKGVEKRISIVEQQVGNLQQSVSSVVESTIQKAIRSQDAKLDAKFSELMGMLSSQGSHGVKRPQASSTEDEEMPSPEKPTAVTR